MNSDREFPSFLKKLPLIYKLFIGFLPILIGALYSYHSTNAVIKNKREFYKKKFTSVVLKSRISEGRTTELSLENGLKIYFWLDAKRPLIIGDSIMKAADT